MFDSLIVSELNIFWKKLKQFIVKKNIITSIEKTSIDSIMFGYLFIGFLDY